MKHVPNTLTIVRILLTPAVLALLFVDTLSAKSWAATLFILASISDYVDGKLARRYEVGSRLGEFLDPLADKILVIGTFVALAVLDPWLVPWWAVVFVVIRDLSVTGLRVWSNRKGTPLRTSRGAKIKTTFQLTFLILVLLLLAAVKLPPAIAEPAQWLLASGFIRGLLIATVVATVATGAVYFARLRNVS